MPLSKVRHVTCSSLYFILFLHFVCTQKYKIPNVKIEVLKTKGFRASIEDSPGIGIFAFNGNVNRNIGSSNVGQISLEVTKPTNGRWVAEDLDLALKAGDVINYNVFVAVNSKGYVADKLTYKVKELQDKFSDEPSVSSKYIESTEKPSTPSNPTHPSCQPSVTRLRSGTACAGQTIFEDNFDTIREDVWQIEQYIPLRHPEYPFISYQRHAVSVENGILKIEAKLQQNVAGYNNESIVAGSLNLFNGCTAEADACMYTSSGFLILPPVVSGRIISKGFAFTYGTVSVRAKLPQGDWLYPEILLEPFLKKYGTENYASGLLKIASARGNKQLFYNYEDYSNKQLYGGPIMDRECRNTLLQKYLKFEGLWGDDYHIYSLKWTPDYIALSVDDTEWMRVVPHSEGLITRFPDICTHLPREFLRQSTKSAPFDQHFYLTLGLASGGVTEFPDDSQSGPKTKPWRNRSNKAMLNFWRDLDSWYPTWKQPALLVDYVKVVAL